MLIAQVTDPHVSLPGTILFGGYDPARALTAVLTRLARLDPRPDLVFLTGDLTENGRPEEYAHFLRLLDGFDLPMAAIPGNHDRRDAFAAAFRDSPVLIGGDPAPGLQLGLDLPPALILGLDTLGLEGDPAGALPEERLAWLARRLEAAEGRPALVFMHHPPILTGIAAMDIWRLADPAPLEALLRRHPNVLRVACGHVHRAVEAGFAGTICGVCPSVAWAVPLFEPAIRAPVVRQCPAFQLHALTPSGLVTHTEFLRDFDDRLPRAPRSD
ncbi:phosphodiesterase [Amaricoccus solimangrovi]|uniref:Phosphodiesterase n=1 Tax=Amaricoccus solimangrovi TaxID=2589815 RepID=A0A501WGN2_9RHOB|nr:phosphodiesterase [Amaricoccus solimangrovi]TPE47952.1 phosphodiesterase [Amaricoccus solimangrovi]